MDNTQTILIIEDEKTIADILVFNLEREGFKAITAYDGAEGAQMALSSGADLILLDVMLPKMDGWSVLKKVRPAIATPIIMLTAREEETDKILGLELGADDYITKPFSTKELIARIRANLRRAAMVSPQPESGNEKNGTIKCKNLIIDPERFTASVDGKAVDLSNKEFSLLIYLAQHPGKAFTREELMESVWGYEGFFGDLRAVDVMVRRLREKLEKDSSTPDFIKTKRGHGYYFDAG